MIELHNEVYRLGISRKAIAERAEVTVYAVRMVMEGQRHAKTIRIVSEARALIREALAREEEDRAMTERPDPRSIDSMREYYEAHVKPRGITQREIGALAGVTQNTVSKAFHPPGNSREVSAAIAVAMYRLCGGDEDIPKINKKQPN